METFLKGFSIGLALIVAIGAQNAYVLTRGICRNHHWVVAAIGAVVDAVLILAGVYGMGTLVKAWPGLLFAVTLGGALFLLAYALLSFRRVFRPATLESGRGSVSLRAAVLAMLAFSLLNPHVYLDTVVLLGSVAIQEPVNARPIFAAGAITASFTWFFSLAFLGGRLQPVFRRPLTWRVLDGLIGIIMLTIAFTLFSNLL